MYSFAPMQRDRWFTVEREKKLLTELKSMFTANEPDNLMRCIEWIRENAQSELKLTEEDLQVPNQGKNRGLSEEKKESGASQSAVALPTIYHTYRITDRKSKFQAHFSRCYSEEEVREVIRTVREDPKCSQAIHPCIYAWRIEVAAQGEEAMGSSDDGEGGAAVFLENLLQTRRITNGVLMVTRWFGGTNLGPDRFRHISSIAEFVLNRCFDPQFEAKPAKPNATSTNQKFSMMAAASKAIHSLESGSSKECTLYFKTPGNVETLSPIKWVNFLNQLANYPLHRLESIQSSNGTVIWSNYSPSDITFDESSK